MGTSSRLPADLAEFVGRDHEIRRLKALSERAGAVAVIAGMPGSGKTTLAAHVARSLPAFASADVAFATAAGLSRHRYDLQRYCSSPLLIADGLRRFEIDALLANLRRPAFVVVTTRDLGCRPATASLIQLPPLADDEAARLLGFLAGPERVCREAEAAAEIVRLCGGLPLALRVAGRQLAGQPRTALKEFAEQLRRGRWRADSRQAVASVIEDARAELPDAARRAFPLLAVAGETFPAAKWEAILEVLDVPVRSEIAGALVRAGLLSPSTSRDALAPTGPPSPPRSRMLPGKPRDLDGPSGGLPGKPRDLDGPSGGLPGKSRDLGEVWRAHPLIVSYAQAQLSRDAGLRTAAADAMIRWHTRSATPGSGDLPALLRAVEVAGAWASRSAVDDLATVADSVLDLLWDRRLWPQWEQLHRAVRAAADRVAEPDLQARASANQVIGHLAQHRLTEAGAELRQAARSRPEGYAPAAGARLWLHEVTLRWLRGDLDGAERSATRALTEANQVEHAGMVLLVRLLWAHLERDRGNVRAAVAQWTDIARDAARECLPEPEVLALIHAAKGSVELGAVDSARELLTQAAIVAATAGAVPHEAIALAELARLEQANGHADRAYAGARRAAALQFGPPGRLDLRPKWIWWPRYVHHAAPLCAAAAMVAVLTAAGAPLYALMGAALTLAAPVMIFPRWSGRTRERLTLNVFRTIRGWLDAPELATEAVPLSRLHYDRLVGGDK